MARRPIPADFFAQVEATFAVEAAPEASPARNPEEILNAMFEGWCEARDPASTERWAYQGPREAPARSQGAGLPSARKGGPLHDRAWARFLAEQPDAARLAQEAQAQAKQEREAWDRLVDEAACGFL